MGLMKGSLGFHAGGCAGRGELALLYGGTEVGRVPPATPLLVAWGPSRVAVGKRRDEAFLLVQKQQPVSSLLLPSSRVCCSPPYLTRHGAYP